MDVIVKHVRVSKLLERRILHGDYLLKAFPTDRDLAAEFQVDTRTARRICRLTNQTLEALLLGRGRPRRGQ